MVSKASLEDAAVDFVSDMIIDGATYASVILTKGAEKLVYHSSNKNWDRIYHEQNIQKIVI